MEWEINLFAQKPLYGRGGKTGKYSLLYIIIYFYLTDYGRSVSYRVNNPWYLYNWIGRLAVHPTFLPILTKLNLQTHICEATHRHNNGRLLT